MSTALGQKETTLLFLIKLLNTGPEAFAVKFGIHMVVIMNTAVFQDATL
jgi:hypothetical protein